MKYWTLYWETAEGISGSRNVRAASRREAEALLYTVAPAGARLLSCKG